MRATTLPALAALLVCPPSFAQTVPAAPQVTVGADLKLLRFDWDDVPGATFYQLHLKPDATSLYAPLGGAIQAPRTLATLTIPVHQFDWVNARYKVAACNSSGCGLTGAIAVTNLMLPAIGYFKASNTDAQDAFGAGLVLSQDGNTLVVSAFEDSGGGGMQPDPSRNDAADSGAVYVFRRVGNGWRQDAYLKPIYTHAGQRFGLGLEQGQRALAVSADGSAVAVGAPGEDWGTLIGTGAVYIFMRQTDGRWQETYKIQRGFPQYGDGFGQTVDLSDDGAVLRVSSTFPRTFPSEDRGATFTFRKTGTVWASEPMLPAENNDTCASQLSSNGEVIVEVCNNSYHVGTRLRTHRRVGGQWARMEDFALSGVWRYLPVISGNGARVAIAVRDQVEARDRIQVLMAAPRNRWRLETYLDLPAGATTEWQSWGTGLAFDRGGTLLAVGSPGSGNGGAGAMDAPLPPSAAGNQQGAVHLFRHTGDTWTWSKIVKASNPGNGDAFGRDITLSGNGLTMGVGAIGEDSAARGIDGNQQSNSRESAGAVYLY